MSPEFENLANRVVSAEEAGIADNMVAPHGHPDHKCSNDFTYEMRFTGLELRVIHRLISSAHQALGIQGAIEILTGQTSPGEVQEALQMLEFIDDKIVDSVRPRIEEQLRAEARWEEFHVD